MEISNFYGNLSITDVQEKAAPVGDSLRVAVTKTSAQGKSAQSAAPNLMSFSTDENSIWFNKKNYGAVVFKDLFGLSTGSSNEEIKTALGGNTYNDISQMIDRGILFLNINNKALQHVMIRIENTGSSEGDYLHIRAFSDASNTAYIKIRHYNGVFNITQDPIRSNIVFRSDIIDELGASLSDHPLSANMGKKLNDEKLPKSSVVNNLTTTDANKALSAAQGKALNDKISALGSVYRIKGSKTNISEVLALTDAKVGDVWNVINAFTLNGKPFPASTNIVCITATSSSDHDEGNWDPIGGTIDLSPYAKKTEVEKSDNEIWEQLGVVVAKDEIVNNLTSSDTNKPLSAAMGKQLNDEKISRSEIVNNLVTNDSSKPLSAAQGKKLQDEKLSKTDANNTYLTKVNAESTYAKKADGISHYSIGELTVLSSNPTQEQLKTALGTPSAFRKAIDAGELILVTGNANVQSQKLATCIIDSGNVIVKYLYPGNNDWTVIAKCVPASSGDNWDNAQFSVRIVKPLDSAGIIIE